VRLLAAVMALAVLAGCGEDDDEGAAAPRPLADVPWQLVSGLDVPGWERAAPTATFGGGRVAGTTGCNRFTAAYALDGDALRLGEVATTRVGCEPERQAVEAAFLERLGRVARARASADALVLLDAGGAELLRFRSPTLEGAWTATAFRRGGAVASPLPGSEVTATFERGALTGSAGCNTYNGSYTSRRGTIEIPRPAATEMACDRPRGVMEQEQAYLAALPEAVRYTVEAGVLTLLAEDGTIVATFKGR
jgi:heat shock protein HslJ